MCLLKGDSLLYGPLDSQKNGAQHIGRHLESRLSGYLDADRKGPIHFYYSQLRGDNRLHSDWNSSSVPQKCVRRVLKISKLLFGRCSQPENDERGAHEAPLD